MSTDLISIISRNFGTRATVLVGSFASALPTRICVLLLRYSDMHEITLVDRSRNVLSLYYQNITTRSIFLLFIVYYLPPLKGTALVDTMCSHTGFVFFESPRKIGDIIIAMNKKHIGGIGRISDTD